MSDNPSLPFLWLSRSSHVTYLVTFTFHLSTTAPPLEGLVCEWWTKYKTWCLETKEVKYRVSC